MIKSSDRLFDTMIDTNKFFVSVKANFKIRDYKNSAGLSPITLHVSGYGERERIQLDVNVDAKYFDRAKQRMKPVKKEFEDINLILENYMSKITEIKTVYRLSDKRITPKIIKSELMGGMTRVNFVAFFKEALKSEYSKNHAPGTLGRFESIYNKLLEFNPNVPFSDIDEKWFEKFRLWAKKRGNVASTINGNVITIKKFLRIAQKEGVRLAFNLDEIPGGSTHGSRTYLSPWEVKILYDYFNASFINETNKLILGYFLFSCMTGLRISDVQSIERYDVKYNEVSFVNTKSAKDQFSLLNRKAQEVIDNCPLLFIKKFADQTINDELKKIFAFCGIKKYVTFHVARHTFATLAIRAKIPVTDLQLLLKHSDIKTTMIYVHIVQREANEQIYAIDNLFE